MTIVITFWGLMIAVGLMHFRSEAFSRVYLSFQPKLPTSIPVRQPWAKVSTLKFADCLEAVGAEINS